MDGVREVIARHKRRELKLITSVLTRVEVLQSKIPVGVGNSFTDLFKRMPQLGMDTKVAGLAHDLRDYYSINAASHGGKTLSTPDTTHYTTPGV